MRPIIRTFIILVSPALLPSCSNALYFYETDKISLTVEARPDSSQPVQGNLGLKQRVALVTPSTKNSKDEKESSVTSDAPIPSSTNKNADGDALSVISSFRFKIEEETGFNPVTIQTAFITGDAASCLNQKQAAQAASIMALSGELEKQNAAIAEIGKLSKDDLEQLFTCFGYPGDKSQVLAKRYEGLTEESFKKAFKRDYKFEAERMLNKYKQCTEKCAHQ